MNNEHTPDGETMLWVGLLGLATVGLAISAYYLLAAVIA